MIRLTRREFVRLVHRAVEELPEPVRHRLDNVDITVEDWPSREQLEEMGLSHPTELLGLYEGVSLAERGDYLPPLPDRIVIFQRPLERICTSLEELQEQVRRTLRHEIGHYLGMDEEHLDRLGYA